MSALWRCPVCRTRLSPSEQGRRWVCGSGHSFDVAREGYVNLLPTGRLPSRASGDSAEMVAARLRWLATGAYDQLSLSVAQAVAAEAPVIVLDVGCGEGHHTRFIETQALLGIDVAKPAIAAAAGADKEGSYAVASASSIPLDDGAVDVAVNVFGPVMPDELARVVRPGGLVVAAHPGERHLEELRRLVYSEARPHEVKSPLRNANQFFSQEASAAIEFAVSADDVSQLSDLFAMTPYRWHAAEGVDDRLRAAAESGFSTVADIRLTTYRRNDTSRH